MQKRSELEGGLNKSTEVVEGGIITIATNCVTATVSEIAIRAAEVIDRRSHRNVVSDLELVPKLPCIGAVSYEV